MPANVQSNGQRQKEVMVRDMMMVWDVISSFDTSYANLSLDANDLPDRTLISPRLITHDDVPLSTDRIRYNISRLIKKECELK